ncbi:hypothetical protein DL89DRAFT_264186 [Linderina pennispora]|uniref:Lipid droplet-associated hydrolase n=1 Tax=Linderina pennispora TaxID=61395 RepID=A0A1Y1WM37_9FUNG|nr:uncharacterized protein DL89DRAFT_264186 [Linderina pennispora]ORX74266.1 hypothetical protein DL89DRAFT_264186 [Linderina pennispora]
MYGGAPKMFLCAHSVGSYIAEKIVESRADRVDRVFDLFPTVDHIGDTPNGRKLQALFRPGVRQVVSGLAELGSWILPNSVMQMLALRSGSLDAENSAVVIDKMVNGSCINNVLRMAADEMATIKDVNEKLYGAMGDKFVMYYGRKDGWVPSDRFKKMCHINYKGNVVMCDKGISHAFVTSHPLETADVVGEFIRQAVNPKASESL